MRISSKVSGLAIGFAKLLSSFIFLFPHSPPACGRGRGWECRERKTCNRPTPRSPPASGRGGYSSFGGEGRRLGVRVHDAVELDVQPEAAHLLDQHVEALRNAGLERVVA